MIEGSSTLGYYYTGIAVQPASSVFLAVEWLQSTSRFVVHNKCPIGRSDGRKYIRIGNYFPRAWNVVGEGGLSMQGTGYVVCIRYAHTQQPSPERE